MSTAFGTIYSAVLVFLTQTLSVRRSLQMDQSLTATHDNAAAWSGIGSAVTHIWHQNAVPASTAVVLSTFLYLANALALHITTSSLFAIVPFNSSRTLTVPTQSLPAFNSLYDAENPDASGEAKSYATESLYFLPTIVANGTTGLSTLGLHEGALYDVLDVSAVTGNGTVNATAFDISCGFSAEVNVTFTEQDGWQGSVNGMEQFSLPSTRKIIYLRISNED
ncbi:hypothetical protein B0H13DRAFT_2682576 [Mycena leptocephala]|nr:hypothetical protein B0H13DRAFT_2682576 [Mycena leptocephala]